jgi:thiosulfate/3-mercaptopyruvate sulfurtransferase
MPSHRFVVPRVLAALALTATLNAANAQWARPTRVDLTVSSAWLADHLRDPDLVLLHVGEKTEYEKEHIPGARFVTLRDISVSSNDREKGLALEVPTADSLRTQLAALGISDNSRVVVYYGNEWVSPTTRVLFTLDVAGFGNRSALLDGGMPQWKAENHPVTAELPAPKTGQLSPLHLRPLVVDAAFVQSHVNAPGYRVLDGRAPVFYDGVEMGSSRKGHIPGAKNLPFTEVTDDKMRLKPVGELTVLFSKAGVNPGDTVVAYCHVGQQATAVLFAARTLGHPVLLYDGSFQDWGRRTDLPVENPAEGSKKP